MLIRFVNATDAEELLNIYRPFIKNTTTSFETTVPSIEEFKNRIINVTQKFPWLVAEINSNITGYAYASRHRERDAYQWSVEASAYVHPQYYRQGVAGLLYNKLFTLLKAQGFINAYAGIALPNDASVGFHTSSGFKPVGVYEKIGFKHGAWHDVLWMVKYINEHTINPTTSKKIHSVQHLL